MLELKSQNKEEPIIHKRKKEGRGRKSRQSLTQVICATLGEENRGQSHKFSPANEHLRRTD